jgi:hypothetical protein
MIILDVIGGLVFGAIWLVGLYHTVMWVLYGRNLKKTEK